MYYIVEFMDVRGNWHPITAFSDQNGVSYFNAGERLNLEQAKERRKTLAAKLGIQMRVTKRE